MHNKTMRGGRNIETVEGALEVARADDNAHAGDPNWTGSYVGEGVVISNNVGIDFERLMQGNIHSLIVNAIMKHIQVNQVSFLAFLKKCSILQKVSIVAGLLQVI